MKEIAYTNAINTLRRLPLESDRMLAGRWMLQKVADITKNPSDEEVNYIFDPSVEYESVPPSDAIQQTFNELPTVTQSMLLDANAVDYIDPKRLSDINTLPAEFLEPTALFQQIERGEKNNATRLARAGLGRLAEISGTQALAAIDLIDDKTFRQASFRQLIEYTRVLAWLHNDPTLDKTIKTKLENDASGLLAVYLDDLGYNPDEDIAEQVETLIRTFPGISSTLLAKGIYGDLLEFTKARQRVINYMSTIKPEHVTYRGIPVEGTRAQLYTVDNKQSQKPSEFVGPSSSTTVFTIQNYLKQPLEQQVVQIPRYYTANEAKLRDEMGEKTYVQTEKLSRYVLRRAQGPILIEEPLLEFMVQRGLASTPESARTLAHKLIGRDTRQIESPLKKYLHALGYTPFVSIEGTNKILRIQSFGELSKEMSGQYRQVIQELAQQAVKMASAINQPIVTLLTDSKFKQIREQYQELHTYLTPFARNIKRLALCNDVVFETNVRGINPDFPIALSKIMECFDRLDETGFIFRNYREDPRASQTLVTAMGRFHCDVGASEEVKRGLSALANNLKGNRMKKV